MLVFHILMCWESGDKSIKAIVLTENDEVTKNNYKILNIICTPSIISLVLHYCLLT
jgi:hypothetical protein